MYWGWPRSTTCSTRIDRQLPSGNYDVPLIVNDVAFTSSGQLLFDDRSDSGLHG